MKIARTQWAASCPYWLLSALLAAVFVQFALDRGGSETAIWAGGVFLAFCLHRRDCGATSVSRRPLVPVGLVVLLLSVSWVFAFDATDTHRSLRLIKFLILVGAVYCLGRRQSAGQLLPPIAAIACLILLWQFVAHHATDSPYGTFDNPHYLAFFSALLLPLLVLVVVETRPPVRYLLLPILLLDLQLLFNDMTKPVIPVLSLATACVLVLFSLLSSLYRGTLVAAAGGLIALAWASGPGVSELFLQDERVRIWSDTVGMTLEAGWVYLLTGHGLGAFADRFPAATIPSYAKFSFPHNHFLQILFENGVPMLILALLALGALFVHSVRLVGDAPTPTFRRVALTNLASFAIWLVFSTLAFGLYSSYTLYPLGFMVGLYLALAERCDRSAGVDDP